MEVAASSSGRPPPPPPGAGAVIDRPRTAAAAPQPAFGASRASGSKTRPRTRSPPTAKVPTAPPTVPPIEIEHSTPPKKKKPKYVLAKRPRGGEIPTIAGHKRGPEEHDEEDRQAKRHRPSFPISKPSLGSFRMSDADDLAAFKDKKVRTMAKKLTDHLARRMKYSKRAARDPEAEPEMEPEDRKVKKGRLKKKYPGGRALAGGQRMAAQIVSSR